jgi:hypothetical protein
MHLDPSALGPRIDMRRVSCARSYSLKCPLSTLTFVSTRLTFGDQIPFGHHADFGRAFGQRALTTDLTPSELCLSKSVDDPMINVPPATFRPFYSPYEWRGSKNSMDLNLGYTPISIHNNCFRPALISGKSLPLEYRYAMMKDGSRVSHWRKEQCFRL